MQLFIDLVQVIAIAIQLFVDRWSLTLGGDRNVTYCAERSVDDGHLLSSLSKMLCVFEARCLLWS